MLGPEPVILLQLNLLFAPFFSHLMIRSRSRTNTFHSFAKKWSCRISVPVSFYMESKVLHYVPITQLCRNTRSMELKVLRNATQSRWIITRGHSISVSSEISFDFCKTQRKESSCSSLSNVHSALNVVFNPVTAVICIRCILKWLISLASIIDG